MEVAMKIILLWDVTPYSLVEVRCIWEWPNCLNPQYSVYTDDGVMSFIWKVGVRLYQTTRRDIPPGIYQYLLVKVFIAVVSPKIKYNITPV
jgi:hypothetical protein